MTRISLRMLCGAFLSVTTCMACRHGAETNDEVNAGTTHHALRVRQLRTGYEGETTAPENVVTASPRAASDSVGWVTVWNQAHVTQPLPPVAFDRETPVLYGFSRGSCSGYHAYVDSAQEAMDTVRIFISEPGGLQCVDTMSYAVVALTVQRPSHLASKTKWLVQPGTHERWLWRR